MINQTCMITRGSRSKLAGAVGWAYAGALGFALVYLGEHYVADLIAGAALTEGVRAGVRALEART